MLKLTAILGSLLIATASCLAQMSSNDVAAVIAQALSRAEDLVQAGRATNGTVAVVDREGFVVGVWSLQPPSELELVDAITKAGTAAFLSSDQNAFSSRTAGFIVQQHFPPGIRDRGPGPLVGVNFSSLEFSDVNRFKNPYLGYDPGAFGGGGTNGAPITTDLAPISGLAGSPGGVPLYKDKRLIGGVGAAVTGKPPIPEIYDIQTSAGQRSDLDEDVALAGQRGYAPSGTILGSHVFIDGIRVPYVNSSTPRASLRPLGSLGAVVDPYAITNSPTVQYPRLMLGGVAGEMRANIIDDPLPGPERLKASDVTNILTLAAHRSAVTRAGIRLPRGQAALVFISVVNNPGQPGATPVVLGTFRTTSKDFTNGATLFSWDVSVQKARTALFFSSPLAASLSNNLPAQLLGKALSTRAVGFLAESLYPPGINGTRPGPFWGLQEYFSLLPSNIGTIEVTNILNGVHFADASDTLSAPDPNLPNGITIFPGGFPLYRNGVLIGAIGVSGDGVDQDDIIAASGTAGFLADEGIRADRVIFRGTRLPYAKFPRNPPLGE